MEYKLKIITKCPLCGGDVVKTSNGYRCVNYSESSGGCRLYLNQVVYNRRINDEDVVALLKEKELLLDGFVKVDGKEYASILKLGEDGDITLDFKVGCTCPKCGGDMAVFHKSFFCLNENCDFHLWRNYSGHMLTLDEVREICTNMMTSRPVEYYNINGHCIYKKLGLAPDLSKLVKI